jgi:hypothetical protein
MVGTDLANPYVFAGFAVHEEMGLFRTAGIPNADILRAATIVPATFCGVADTLGTIRAGKIASMVLLRGNPLEDIGNVKLVEGVFLRGRYFSRNALDAMLDDVETVVVESMPNEAAVVELDLPGEEIIRGRYVMKFQQWDGGFEDFLITRDDDGYHVMTHSQPQGGPQPPYVMTVHAGPAYEFVSGDWTLLQGSGLKAQYTREDDAIAAVARGDDGEPKTQSFEIPVGGLFAGPPTATDFLTIGRAGLVVGESRTFRSWGFGFDGWRLGDTDYTLSRGQDGTLTLDGEAVVARHYEYSITSQMGELTGDTWTDERGVTLKSVLVLPFGEFKSTLEGVE